MQTLQAENARRAPYIAAIGDPERLCAMLAASAQSQSVLDELVFTAANRKHYVTARALLDRGASANAEECGMLMLPMLLGAHSGSAKFEFSDERKVFCEELVRRGAAIEPEHHTPLYYCAAFGYVEPVRFLLAHGALVNGLRSSEASSPLNGAANEARIDVVRMLLQAGADPNAVARDGYSVLHAAVSGCDAYEWQPAARLEVVRLLLAHGVDTSGRWHTENFPLKRGATALQVARKLKRPAIAAALAQ